MRKISALVAFLRGLAIILLKVLSIYIFYHLCVNLYSNKKFKNKAN